MKTGDTAVSLNGVLKTIALTILVVVEIIRLSMVGTGLPLCREKQQQEIQTAYERGRADGKKEGDMP